MKKQNCPLMVRLSEDLLNQVKCVASHHEMTMSQFVRSALVKAVREVDDDSVRLSGDTQRVSRV